MLRGGDDVRVDPNPEAKPFDLFFLKPVASSFRSYVVVKSSVYL